MTQQSGTASDRGLLLAGVSWIVGLGAYVYAAFTGFTLGEELAPAAQTRVLVAVTVAMALTTVPPLSGLLVALHGRRVLASVAMALAVTLAAIPVVLFGADVARDWRDRLAPDPPSGEPNGCVVFSGGSSSCPGG